MQGSPRARRVHEQAYKAAMLLKFKKVKEKKKRRTLEEERSGGSGGGVIRRLLDVWLSPRGVPRPPEGAIDFAPLPHSTHTYRENERESRQREAEALASHSSPNYPTSYRDVQHTDILRILFSLPDEILSLSSLLLQ